MKTVRIDREKLLKIVKENREEHRGIFLKAQKKYREQVIEELDRMLADARKGNKIRRRVELPEPEDHTDSYDRVIRMLEMSVDDTIELSRSEFQHYVMDQWDWQRSFTANTTSYVE